MSKWLFRKLRADDIETDPRGDMAFNTTENTKVNALVRESIQNSLDAKDGAAKSVIVCYTFGKHQNGSYYDGLIPHIKGSGIRLQQNPDTTDTTKHLCIEDFGTKGLNGPEFANLLQSGEKSSFISFFKREGKSDKTGIHIGNKGLGKWALYAASQMRTIFAVSVSESKDGNNETRLLGKSNLKSHSLPDSPTRYDYYGFYGNEDEFEDGAKVAWAKTGSEVAGFSSSFKLGRGSERGLSIVIPMPIEDLDNESLKRSVVMNYAYPVLKEMLTVRISENGQEEQIDLNNVTELAIELTQNGGWAGTPWSGKSKEDIQNRMDFLEDIVTSPDEAWVQLNLAGDQLIIKEKAFGDHLDKLQKEFAEGNTVKIRIPVTIKKIQENGSDPQQSHFDVAVKKDNDLKSADVEFYRGGIKLNQVKANLGSLKVRAIFHARDEFVSAFLGAAEDPGHNTWTERADELKQGYENSTNTLRFIKNSIKEITNVLHVSKDEEDPDWALGLFSIKRRRGIPNIESRPRDFAIRKTPLGFQITLSKNEKQLPFEGEMKVAYKVLGGGALSEYSPTDFTINSGLNHRVHGGDFIHIGDNLIRFRVNAEDFSLTLEGFDSNRDIEVDVRKVSDES